MNLKIQGVIFDMDGTLIDSMWMWKSIDEDFLRRFNLTVPDDLAEAIEGMSYEETAHYFKERFCLPLSEEEIMDTWNQMTYDKYCNEVAFKPGAKQFLMFLKENQIPIGIATSNSRVLVEAVLTSLGVLEIFTSITTSSDVKRGKPYPDVYLKTAQAMKVNPESCLVFEDVPAGILAGKAANMNVIAIKDDFSAHLEEKKRKLAAGMIESYEDILEQIQVTDEGVILCFK